MDRVALGLQEKRSETTTTRKEEGMVWPALTSRKKPGIFRKVNIVDGNFAKCVTKFLITDLKLLCNQELNTGMV